jgi:hypothetical protein
VALCHIQAAQAEARMAAGLARGGQLARSGARATPRVAPSRTSRATSRPIPAIPVSR